METGADVFTTGTTFVNAFAGSSPDHLAPPEDGDYMVAYEAVTDSDGSANLQEIAIGKNSTTVAEVDSVRELFIKANNNNQTCVILCTLTGLVTTDKIYAIYRNVSGTKKFIQKDRSLTLLKVSS